MKTTDATLVEVTETGPDWMRFRGGSRQLLLFALVGMVCVGALLRVLSLNSPRRSPDEGNYTYQAGLVLHGGRAAFPTLIRDFERDISLPPPTRAGFLYVLAGIMALTGKMDVMAGVWLSCVASLLSLVLLARIAWRFLDPVAAVFAVAFYAVSALPLMTGRRVWEDALVEMLTLFLLLTGFEIMRRAGHWLWSLAFAIAGGFCLTMKEVPAAVFFLISACVLWTLFRTHRSKQLLIFSMLWVAFVAAAIGWLVFLLGDAKLLIEFPHMTSTFLAGSAYSQTYEGGSAMDLLHGFWVVSPFATVCFPLGLTALAVNHFGERQQTQHITILMAVFTLLFLATAMFLPHHLNFRYLCPVFGMFYAIGGIGFSWAAGEIRERLPASQRSIFLGCSIFALVFCAVGDYANFRIHFVQPDLQDLSLRMVLSGSNE